MGANICLEDNTVSRDAYALSNGTILQPNQLQQPQHKYAAVAQIAPTIQTNIYKPQSLPTTGQAATIPMSKPIVNNLTAADIKVQPVAQTASEIPAPPISSIIPKPSTTTSMSSIPVGSSMRRDLIRESLDNSIYLGLNTPSLLTSKDQSEISSQLLQTQQGLQSMVEKVSKK